MTLLIEANLPRPLEALKTPQELSGEFGTNRAPAFVTQQIAATNDLQAIRTWLAEFERSRRNQYRSATRY